MGRSEPNQQIKEKGDISVCFCHNQPYLYNLARAAVSVHAIGLISPTKAEGQLKSGMRTCRLCGQRAEKTWRGDRCTEVRPSNLGRVPLGGPRSTQLPQLLSLGYWGASTERTGYGSCKDWSRLFRKDTSELFPCREYISDREGESGRQAGRTGSSSWGRDPG